MILDASEPPLCVQFGPGPVSGLFFEQAAGSILPAMTLPGTIVLRPNDFGQPDYDVI
jgi:hypothetical protein